MFKILIAVFVLTFSSFAFSDDALTTEVTKNYSMIGDLTSCKIYKADNGGWQQGLLYITVCPEKNTTTTFKEGKKDRTVSNISSPVEDKQLITVNGVEYYSEKYLNNPKNSEKININGKTYYKLKEN